METPNQIDALAEQAATHWPMVRFYPTLGGGWCASALGAPEMRAATLSEVVAMAAACKPMPIVPRCPAHRVLRVEKSTGSNPWHIKEGSQVVYGAKTKREAEEVIERTLCARDAAIAEWHDLWDAVVCSGVEGVDFKWKE